MRLAATAIVAVTLFGTPALAEDFELWLAKLKTEALAKGISKTTVANTLDDLELIPRVIELDRRQPEFTLTFQEYMDRVVPQSRIEKARDRYDTHKELLAKTGKKYGVQPRFIVALWGIETDFGRVTGGFDVIPALATLAHDSRRGAFFRTQLFNALEIIDGGHIEHEKMTGSWAGAMGQVQFMPSSFKNFAVDVDGDGRKNLWSSLPDIFGSAANYLAGSGWNVDETWGRKVRLPSGFAADLIGRDKKSRSAKEWQALGVRDADGGDLPDTTPGGTLVRPGDGTEPTFLVHGNYQAILKWNRSDFFALAVGQLADAIVRR